MVLSHPYSCHSGHHVAHMVLCNQMRHCRLHCVGPIHVVLRGLYSDYSGLQLNGPCSNSRSQSSKCKAIVILSNTLDG